MFHRTSRYKKSSGTAGCALSITLPPSRALRWLREACPRRRDTATAPAARRAARAATVAVLLLPAAVGGCATPPTPVINGFPAGPGTRGSAAPVLGRFAAPTAPSARAPAGPAAGPPGPGTYAALSRNAL